MSPSIRPFHFPHRIALDPLVLVVSRHDRSDTCFIDWWFLFLSFLVFLVFSFSPLFPSFVSVRDARRYLEIYHRPEIAIDAFYNESFSAVTMPRHGGSSTSTTKLNQLFDSYKGMHVVYSMPSLAFLDIFILIVTIVGVAYRSRWRGHHYRWYDQVLSGLGRGSRGRSPPLSRIRTQITAHG